MSLSFDVIDRSASLVSQFGEGNLDAEYFVRASKTACALRVDEVADVSPMRHTAFIS